MKNKLLNKLITNAKYVGKVIMWLAGIVVICVLLYFFYWVGKSASYNLFYKDMVIETTRDTIHEMVKPDALK